MLNSSRTLLTSALTVIGSFLNPFKYLVAICLTVLGVGTMSDGFKPQYVFLFLEEITILNELCTGFTVITHVHWRAVLSIIRLWIRFIWQCIC